MTDLIIREATVADAERLSLIASATFIDTFAGVLDGDAVVVHCTSEHAPDQFAAMLAKGARAWIAELGGAPIGYALLKQPELEAAREGDVELKKIYVLSRFHGTGIARALFDAALKGSKGFERLLLGVKDDNNRAIAFYSKMGFEQIGTRRFPVGDQLYDDLVMALVLPRQIEAAE